jgi:5-methylcytosine-specific restriction endonuclease McrA
VIPLGERQALRRRFAFRCGYCRVREDAVGAELTVDHFQPRSCGGAHTPENLVYCCHACNEFKGDYWEPESPRRILHPERDSFAEHVAAADDGTVRGLTEPGAGKDRPARNLD